MPSTNASSATSPPAGGTRSRLRGFSYLRSHGNSATNNSNSNSNSNNNNNNNNSNNLSAHITAPTMSPPVTMNPPVSTSPPASPTSPRRSTSPLTNNNVNANGGGALTRVATSVEPSTAAQPNNEGIPLARSVSEGAARSIDAALTSNLPEERTPGASATTAAGAAANQEAEAPQPSPSIRFVPHIDPRSTRQSLTFPPMERTLRHNDEVIRVGRYSDRDAGNPTPVGFKSKVVSRRHCEFWCHKGQWYVKDVKSSSGTFLNHIRLSSPGVESKAFPLFDGDIIQLGIDFKGGEELIFRCVKIRVELNRAWQKGLNSFNVSTHKKLQNLGKTLKPKDSDTSSTHTSECAICLMNVAPCQSLFVAPCSHVWHYKCVRPIISKSYPAFLCPNCRAVADLERDIEEDNTWQVVEEEEQVQAAQPHVNAQSDQDEDGVVVVTSAQAPAEPEIAPGASSERLAAVPPAIAVNGGNHSDIEMTGTDATNEESAQDQDPESPPASAASASSFVNETDHQQVMGGANETFVSLNGSTNGQEAPEPQNPAPSLAMLSLNTDRQADIGEGSSSSSHPITIVSPRRKPLRNGTSDSTPSLNLGLAPSGSSRGDANSPDNQANGDTGPLTPKNHIGPFVLDGLVERG